MQDKQILGLLEKYSKQRDVQALYSQAQEIISRLTADDKPFITSHIVSGLQSTDPQIQINYALLLSEALRSVRSLTQQDIIDAANLKLAKRNALTKSEYKHFLLAKYMVYSLLEPSQKLIQLILADKETLDVDYFYYILIKQIKPDNVKLIVQSVKNDLTNLTPSLFSLLVSLQEKATKGVFPWDKLLQEQVFDRTKLRKLIDQALLAFPRRQLFYQYLVHYLARFANKQESQEIFDEFWQFILALDLKKKTYVALQLLKHFLKNSSLPLDLVKNAALMETWFRSMGTLNPDTKKLSLQVEKHLVRREISYPFLAFLRSLYGYRINPKSLITSCLISKLSEQEVLAYFKLMRKILKTQTDPIKKLYYLNEIYVLGVANYDKIKAGLYPQLVHFVYETSCKNYEALYQSLDDESKEAYTFEEVKKKVEDQGQGYYFSLTAKAAQDQEQFGAFLDQLLLLCKNAEPEKFDRLIELKEEIRSDVPQLQHLIDCVFSFTAIHFEEGISVLEELKHVAIDLKTGEPKTKKKQKTNSGKAKIVLTEIMIQLLTKSPAFLRDAVNDCFKAIEFEAQSLEILLDVLLKQDQEYLVDMVKQEVGEDAFDEEGEVQSAENGEDEGADEH